MPTYAGTNCQYLEETSFKIAGASLTMGLYHRWTRNKLLNRPTCIFPAVNIPLTESVFMWIKCIYATQPFTCYFTFMRQSNSVKNLKEIRMYK
jgi:hypothetical protein